MPNIETYFDNSNRTEVDVTGVVLIVSKEKNNYFFLNISGNSQNMTFLPKKVEPPLLRNSKLASKKSMKWWQNEEEWN